MMPKESLRSLKSLPPPPARRAKFEEKARAYYASQILSEARRESGMTQNELARRVGMTRAQIAKIENGTVEPGVGLFYRIVGELGLRVDIVRPL